jgi:hypothetical protein
MMKTLILSLSGILLLASCKKEKLEDDKSIFEGKWRLDHVIEREFFTNSGNEVFDTIKVDYLTDVYELEFCRKGFVHQIKNGNKLREARTVFAAFEMSNPNHLNKLKNSFWYTIKLDNDEDDKMSGYVSPDTLTSTADFLPAEFDDHQIGNVRISYSRRYLRSN